MKRVVWDEDEGDEDEGGEDERLLKRARTERCYCGAGLVDGGSCEDGCDWAGPTEEEDNRDAARGSGCECPHHRRLRRKDAGKEDLEKDSSDEEKDSSDEEKDSSDEEKDSSDEDEEHDLDAESRCRAARASLMQHTAAVALTRLREENTRLREENTRLLEENNALRHKTHTQDGQITRLRRQKRAPVSGTSPIKDLVAEAREMTGYERNDDVLVKYLKEQEIDIRRPTFTVSAPTLLYSGVD